MQNERLINYLKSGRGITSKEAADMLGIQRLSGRIFDLKRMGLEIVEAWETSKNRYGDIVRYKRYFLRRPYAEN